MKKILFYIHGGNVNRGCEAIITSTSKLIKDNIRSSNITISTEYYNEDISRKIDNIDRYVKAESSPKNIFERIYRIGLRSFNLNKINIKSIYKDTVKEIKNNDISFVIGGDTYFKNYGMLDTLYTLNKEVRKANKKNVLWCCSIEESEIDEAMKKDLEGFDLIIARESITEKNLKEKGIKENVKIFPDPAFSMESSEVILPKGWKNGKTILINTSPLIKKFEKKEGLLEASIESLIKYILKNTDSNVALIPHVDCDVLTNNNIYERFKDESRVLNIDFKYTATQYKYIISKSEMLIAARTHASIAAYSTCIPTLVIGYSVKSVGIARDIFGDEKDYVIPIDKIYDENILIKLVDNILCNKEKIKEHLEAVMPDYIRKSKDSIKEVIKLMK
ncbi:MAG: polysaccharide pyruvyl transferase family protein [Clostridium sp.]|uniref:polysaccharide pyruvyl transferase family protein n=1 Tax=Clostridium sp. TaxID=1506 RepID=UPI003F335AA3